MKTKGEIIDAISQRLRRLYCHFSDWEHYESWGPTAYCDESITDRINNYPIRAKRRTFAESVCFAITEARDAMTFNIRPFRDVCGEDYQNGKIPTPDIKEMFSLLCKCNKLIEDLGMNISSPKFPSEKQLAIFLHDSGQESLLDEFCINSEFWIDLVRSYYPMLPGNRDEPDSERVLDNTIECHIAPWFDKSEVTGLLQHLLAGTKGRKTATVIMSAKKAGVLLSNPTFSQLSAHFGVGGNSSTYYSYLNGYPTGRKISEQDTDAYMKLFSSLVKKRTGQ